MNIKGPSFSQRVRQIQTPVRAEESRESQPDSYQQTQPNLVDPVGDAEIIRMVDQVPEAIVGGVWDYLTKGEKWHDHGGPPSQKVESGPEPLINSEAILKEFSDFIHNQEIQPYIGPEHRWSPEAEEYRGFGFWRRVGDALLGRQDFPCPLPASKLVTLLATGQTARFAITGQEAALEKTLMTYSDGTVRVTDMLKESYKLHKGDLYKTLLCAENILAHDVNDPERESQPLQSKLAYLRDDSPQKGDNFGAWYHFFGTALYGLVRGGIKAKSVALAEAAGSLLMEGPDRQETRVNVMGAELGGELRKAFGEKFTTSSRHMS